MQAVAKTFPSFQLKHFPVELTRSTSDLRCLHAALCTPEPRDYVLGLAAVKGTCRTRTGPIRPNRLRGLFPRAAPLTRSQSRCPFLSERSPGSVFQPPKLQLILLM